MRQQAARNSNDQESISRRSRACRRPVTCTAVSCRKCPYLSLLPVKLISTAARSSTGNPAANPAVQTVTKSAIYTKLSAPALVFHGICALAASEIVTFNFHSHVVAVDPLQLQLLLGQPRAAQRKRRVPVTWRPGRYAKHIVCVILVARRFTQTLFEHAYRQMQTAFITSAGHATCYGRGPHKAGQPATHMGNILYSQRKKTVQWAAGSMLSMASCDSQSSMLHTVLAQPLHGVAVHSAIACIARLPLSDTPMTCAVLPSSCGALTTLLSSCTAGR